MTKLIPFIFLYLNIGWTAEISLSSGKEFVGRNADEKDFRVDVNLDGKSDIWQIKKAGVSVNIDDETSGQKIINIKDTRGKENIDIIAIEKNGSIKVTSLTKSSKETSNLSCSDFSKLHIKTQECQDIISARFEGFSSNLQSIVLADKAAKIWDKSCTDFPDFEEPREVIQKTFIETLQLGPGQRNSFISCLEQAERDAKGKEKEKIALWVLKAKDTVADFYEEKFPKDMLSCVKGNADKIVSNGSSGKIVIHIKDGSEFASVAMLKKSFFSALLNNIEVGKGEESLKISELCLKGDSSASSQAIIAAALKGGSTQSGRTIEALNQSADAYGKKIASNSELAGINKKLAETKVNIPSAEETSPMALAAIERTQGPEAAQRVARSQSSSLMNAANTVLGAVSSPAVASSRSLASTSDSSSKRESIKFGESVVGKRLPASAVKARGIASDEQIVEEIDLSKRTQNSAATRSKATANGGSSRLPASSGAKGSNVEATALSDEGDQELGRAGSSPGAAPTGGGSRGSLLSDNSAQGPQQGQARSASRSGGATASPAREEVVSYFRNADYSQARRKLRDPSFIKILKENSITVMDLAGNSYGATRGSTIFLDQGDRFVRQK